MIQEYGYGYDGGFPIIHILFWVLIICAIFAIARAFRRRNCRHCGMWGMDSNRWDNRFGNSDGAVELLRERYAKGEIGRAEFEEKMNDLSARNNY